MPRRPFLVRRARRRTRRANTRAGRAGMAPVNMLAGTVIGAGAAVGAAALLNTAAQAAGKELPQVVRDYAPIAGALVVAGLSRLAPKFRGLTMPALIGGAAVVGLNMLLARRGAGAYNRLRGAGNVARALTGNGVAGAGNVARTLAYEAA